MLFVNPFDSAADRLTQSRDAMGAARDKKALEEFERVFVLQLLQGMRRTTPGDAVFGGTSQQQYFQEMLDDALAGEIAKSGQFGIAKTIQAQMDAKGAGAKALASYQSAALSGGPARQTAPSI